MSRYQPLSDDTNSDENTAVSGTRVIANRLISLSRSSLAAETLDQVVAVSIAIEIPIVILVTIYSIFQLRKMRLSLVRTFFFFIHISL